jgi:exopolyphosphatase/guanosine-5'-triphosphate,3'-diphosphate pyrophosphatase
MYLIFAVPSFRRKKRGTLLPIKRIAAVDLGSNSFHMIIAEVKENGSFEIIERRREIVRLGSRKKGNLNYITEEELQNSIGILNEFKKVADRYNAAIKAVATSAVRESSNWKTFIDKIFNEISIEVEIISGGKEAELIFLGAAEGFNLKEKKVIVIDIGGGSTEIIIGHGEKITSAASIQLGSVRLMRDFFPDYIVAQEKINACRNFIKEELKKSLDVPKFNWDVAAGASGTILSIGLAIYIQKHGKLPERINKAQITDEDLKRFSETVLSKSSVQERLLIPGIEEKRADVLPAGILILDELFVFFNLKSLSLSESGLREGIIRSYLNLSKAKN